MAVPTLLLNINDNPRIYVRPDYQPAIYTGYTQTLLGSGSTTCTLSGTTWIVYSSGGTGGGTWGTITGTITNQTDLINYLHDTYVTITGNSMGDTSTIESNGWIAMSSRDDAIPARYSNIYADSTQVSLQVVHESLPFNEFRVAQGISYSRVGIDYLTPMSGITWNDETLISREYADGRYTQTGTTAALSTAFSTYTGTTAPAQFVDVSGDTMTGQLSVPSIYIQTGATVSHATGVLHWSTTDGTAEIGMYNGVILQLGQELHSYAHAAEDLANGDLVYLYGQGDELRCAKVIADNTITAAAVGMVTQDGGIANGEWGYITKYGYVRDLDTTGIASGTQLWLSTSTAGEWETTMPEYPSQSMLIGRVIRGNHATEGSVYVNPACNFKSQADYNTSGITALSAVTTGQTAQISALETFSANTITQWTDAEDPTGFVDGSNIDISYDWSTRTVTLTGDLSYYWNGIKHTLTSPWTSTGHTASVGAWYLYSTDGETFAWSNTPWNFDNLQVAAVYYRASSGTTFGIRETHQLMPWTTHRTLHNTIGTYHLSGGMAVAGTYTLSSDVDADKKPTFAQAVIVDEDLTSNVAQLSGASEGYTAMYVSGYTASIFANQTLPINASGSYLLVNNPQTGGLAAGVANRFYNVYQILVPVTSDATSQVYRQVFLQPQVAYTTLAAAQAEDVRGLYLGDLSSASPEFVIYGRMSFYTSGGYTSTGKAVLAGISYVLGSKASQISIAGISATNHANLSNLNWLISGHIASVNDSIATFNGTGVAELTPKATYTLSGTTAALQSAFETYTGVTAPAQFLSITGLTGYWNSGETVSYVTGLGYITGVAWGDITGDISGNTTLQDAFDAKLTKSVYQNDMLIIAGEIDALITGVTANTASIANAITGITGMGTGSTLVHGTPVADNKIQIKSITATNLTLNDNTNDVNIEAGSIAPKDFWTGTEAEYAALGSYDANTLYFCTA